MRRIIFFVITLIFSMATCSQAANRRQVTSARDAFEVKQSVLFEDGSLDEVLTSDWDSTFTHITNQERRSASGAMLEQIEFSYHEDRGYLTTRITRDVESRLRNRIVYQYNAQGNLWRESLVDNRNRVVSTYEFDYDNRGNRTGRRIMNRAGDLLAETLFTFDGAGRMTTSTTRDGGGSVISSTRFSYDSQGNLISQQVLNSDGAVTTNVSARWQDGLEMVNETRAPDNTLRLEIRNEYGDDRELVRRVIRNIQGESTQILQFEYTFRPRRQS